ncbi:hypothetical protein F444_15401 [Phytophthora nicotianae P1976]|uniref:Uncharacterized protein n=1 Tax=Phytophthora nicotianae P1976 TaxID=1317066 RepID=A0A080ZM37_PHYNI|nr:hypothetical protein F444_15401 [Phytophthora nicotianae P1976]
MPGVDQDKLLRTVQNTVRNYRRSVLHDNDFIDEMVALALKNRFRDAMDDTTAFAFGFDLDHKNEPILGRVEGDDPLIVGFATKSTIRRLDNSAQHSAFEVVALQMLRMDQQLTYIMCFFSCDDQCA